MTNSFPRFKKKIFSKLYTLRLNILVSLLGCKRRLKYHLSKRYRVTDLPITSVLIIAWHYFVHELHENCPARLFESHEFSFLQASIISQSTMISSDIISISSSSVIGLNLYNHIRCIFLFFLSFFLHITVSLFLFFSFLISFLFSEQINLSPSRPASLHRPRIAFNSSLFHRNPSFVIISNVLSKQQ